MSSSLAFIILNELRKLKLRTSVFGFDGTFSDKELDSITELEIKDCDSLEGISKLKNLKTLRILSSDLSSFSNIKYLNAITDFDEIDSLTNLETLEIYFDENISTLDIANLKHLKTLRLFCNVNLEQIKGLDSLKELEEIIICECPIMDMGNMKDYIRNTSNAAKNYLDFKIFINLLNNEEIIKMLKDYYDLNLSNIKYCERIYFDKKIFTIHIYQMIEMLENIKKILTELNIENYNKDDQMLLLYKYVVDLLSYDNDGLEFRNNGYAQLSESTKDNKSYLLRRMAMINSSYFALKTKTAVCDGYVNLIRILCAYLKIKTRTVICKKDGLTHAALKFQLNDKWYYADPQKEVDGKNIEYYKLNKEEFEKLYELSPKEEVEGRQLCR